VIEEFRHEALNQATVIAGFSEIIENLVQKQAMPIYPEFITTLRKIKVLIVSFSKALSAFREESIVCCAEGALPENPEEIWGMLSPACRLHYDVLQEIAAELLKITEKITPDDIGNPHLANRFYMIQEAVRKVSVLLEDPVAYLKKNDAGDQAAG
jgi:hypothetical protein